MGVSFIAIGKRKVDRKSLKLLFIVEFFVAKEFKRPARNFRAFHRGMRRILMDFAVFEGGIKSYIKFFRML